MIICIPKTSTRPDKPGKPLWMNHKALASVKRKTFAYRRYLNTREGHDYLEYAKARNVVKKECRNAKAEFEHKLAQKVKSNPKAFYNYANSKLKTRSNIADLEKSDGTTTKNDSEKAETLNDFFSSVFTDEDTSSIPEPPEHDIRINLEELHITIEGVFKKLSDLKPNKSPGPDGLHPRVLIELADEISLPLQIIMSKSLSKGELERCTCDTYF